MSTPTVAAGDHRWDRGEPHGKNVYVTNFLADGADGVSQYTVGRAARYADATRPSPPANGRSGSR